MKKMKLLLIAGVGIMLLASSGTAPAAIVVGDSAPPKPLGGEWLDWTINRPEIKQEFTVPNVARPDWTKFLWMEVSMDSMNAFPQAPDNPQGPGSFDPSLWPSVSAAGSTTVITGAASAGYNNPSGPWDWYLTAMIYPQPASETITFPGGWWNAWGTHITKIEVYTDCVPEPSSIALSLVVLAGAAGYGVRRHRRSHSA